MHAICNYRLLAGWQKLPALFISQAKLICKAVDNVGDFDIASQSRAKHWQHQRLIVRDQGGLRDQIDNGEGGEVSSR